MRDEENADDIAECHCKDRVPIDGGKPSPTVPQAEPGHGERRGEEHIVEYQEDDFFYGPVEPGETPARAEHQVTVAVPDSSGEQDEVKVPEPVGQMLHPEVAEQSGNVGNDDTKQRNAHHSHGPVVEGDNAFAWYRLYSG